MDLDSDPESNFKIKLDDTLFVHSLIWVKNGTIQSNIQLPF